MSVTARCATEHSNTLNTSSPGRGKPTVTNVVHSGSPGRGKPTQIRGSPVPRREAPLNASRGAAHRGQVRGSPAQTRNGNPLNVNAKTPQQLQQMSERRTKILQEFLQTEVTYVSNLLTMKQLAEGVDRRNLLKEEDKKVLFMNVVQIAAVHQNFLSNLTSRFSPGINEKTTVTDIFFKLLEETNIEQLYQHYYNHYNRAIQFNRNIISTNEAIDSYFIDMLKDRSPSTLESYLITAVQRPPRYVLLLKEIIKVTPENHEEYNNILKSLRLFEQFASNLDKGMEEFVNREERHKLYHLFQENDRVNVSELLGDEKLVDKEYKPIIRLFDEAAEEKQTGSDNDYECNLILLENHIIGFKKTVSLLGGSNYKFLWKIEVLSSDITYFKPDLYESPNGKISIVEIKRIMSPPYLYRAYYSFVPITDFQDANWDHWENKFKLVFKKPDIHCMYKRATIARSHLQNHILDENDWNLMSIGGTKTHYDAPGDYITEQGEPINAVHFVQEGSVLVVKQLSDKDYRTLATVTKGNFVGEISFLSRNIPGTNPTASAGLIIGAPDTTIFKISHDKLEFCIKNNPKFGWKFYLLLCVHFAYRIIRADCFLSSGKNFNDYHKSITTSIKSNVEKESQEPTNVKKEKISKYKFIEVLLKEKILVDIPCKFTLHNESSFFSGHIFISNSKVCLYRSVFGKKTQVVLNGDSFFSVSTLSPTQLEFSYMSIRSSVCKASLEFKTSKDKETCASSLENFLPDDRSKLILKCLDIDNDPADTIHELFSKENYYSKGQVVIEQGIISTQIFQIISGQCVVCIGNYTVRVLDAGDIFGELSFILGSVTTATVTVNSQQCVIATCDSTDISAVSISHPEQAMLFYEFLAQTLSKRFLAGEQELIRRRLGTSR